MPDDNKWGFFAALLDANEGDYLQTGGFVLITNHPHIQYRKPELLWTVNCDQIMIGSRTLWDYMNWVVTGPTWRDLAAQYWRDTSPSYYMLYKPHGSKRYVDGSDMIDIPDFHSLDMSVGIGSIDSKLPGIGSLNVSFIDDRSGKQYITFPDITIDQSIIELILKRFGKNVSLSFPIGAAYSEGYACNGGNGISDCMVRSRSSVPDSNRIKNTISGPCYSSGAILVLGMKLVSCQGGTSAVVVSYGYAASIGGSGSVGWHHNTDPSSGWDWAIKDRLNGVSYADLYFKAYDMEH
jgi:hypothetical protein